MDIDSLDLKLLRAFQLVAQNGNLRLAAARLNQSIPAVSNKLRRLEDSLGVQLFERLPNRLILTRTGRGFLDEVEQLFGQAEHTLRYLSQKAVIKGRLSVSTGSDHYWRFSPKISRFLMQHPEVDLSLQVHHSVEALEALGRGELDVSIGVFSHIPKTLQEEVLTETSLCLVCQEGDPILRRTPPKLSELAQRRLILLPQHTETRRVVERLLAKARIKLGSVIEVANCQTAGVMVREGVGVGLLHTKCVEFAPLPGTRAMPLDPGLARVSFSAVYRQRDAGSPLIRAFLDGMAAEGPAERR